MEPFDSYREQLRKEYESILKNLDEKYKKLIESASKSLYSEKS